MDSTFVMYYRYNNGKRCQIVEREQKAMNDDFMEKILYILCTAGEIVI